MRKNKKRDWVKIVSITLAIMFFIFWIGSIIVVVESESELEEIQESLNESSELNENLKIVEEINQNYYNTHTYSSTDFFVCADMAIDVWNLIKTQGIDAKICAGNIDKNISRSSIKDIQTLIEYFNQVNHAWVIAEINPFEFVAVETTGGFLVFDENDLYYKADLCFDSPAEFKRFVNLRTNLIQTCQESKNMINFWNENYVGKYTTPETSEFKGKMDLKKEECEKLDVELYGLLA